MMACSICGAGRQWHGSDGAARYSSLSETGCHDGVMMDDDEHAEGWHPNVVYPPCPNNPRACAACKGSGEAGPEVTTQDDCPDCDGTGWKDGKTEWPVAAGADVSGAISAIYRRMGKALARGTGVRLSADDVRTLNCGKLGEWMGGPAPDHPPTGDRGAAAGGGQ